MVVQWINWNPPNPNGNFELEIQHVNGLQDALDNVATIKGEDGYTPIKGVDYFDGENGYTPIKGVDYFDGQDGYTPIKGVDYVDGKDGEDGYTPVKGVDYNDGKDGENGTNGIAYVNDPTKQLKLWKGRATLESTLGTFSIDYSQANFSTVISVQAQILGSGQLQADFPIAVTIHDTYTNTTATGKAFSATSMGLVAAVQQMPAEPGTKVDIVVIGY